MKKLTLILIAFVTVASVPFAAFTPPINAAEKQGQVTVISQGQKVTLADNLVAGKITVFDFTSKYCPPCMLLSPALDKLHQKRADLAVVKVDINRPDVKRIDWQSPVAQQFKLRSIPHIKIYGADGKLISEGDKAMSTVLDWLKAIGETPFGE